MLLKFKPLVKTENGTQILPGATMKELIEKSQICDEYLQYTGVDDKDKHRVYQGDLLELQITDELMDHSKNTFFNSNLGIDLRKHPDVISVLLYAEYNPETKFIGCYYDVYYMNKDFKIIDENNEISTEPIVSSGGTMFPCYLCEKGARIITSTLNITDVLQNISEHSLWKKNDMDIPQHAITEKY